MALTRENILLAATRLAGEKGVESLSMRGIARELGVSPMALYNHVADREDLVSAIAESFVTYALTGDGGVREAATRFFEGLKQWPYLVPLVRESLESSRFVAVDSLLARYTGTDHARATEDWVELSELALGLVDAARRGHFPGVEIARVFERAVQAVPRI